MYDKSGNLKDRRELLKIKFNSLMAEAKIIRAAERKQLAFLSSRAVPLNPWLYEEMHQHRTLGLRKEARLTHLALGFIKGRTLKEMEPTCKTKLTADDWKAIHKMVAKYGDTQVVFLNKEKESAVA